MNNDTTTVFDAAMEHIGEPVIVKTRSTEWRHPDARRFVRSEQSIVPAMRVWVSMQGKPEDGFGNDIYAVFPCWDNGFSNYLYAEEAGSADGFEATQRDQAVSAIREMVTLFLVDDFTAWGKTTHADPHKAVADGIITAIQEGRYHLDFAHDTTIQVIDGVVYENR